MKNKVVVLMVAVLAFGGMSVTSAQADLYASFNQVPLSQAVAGNQTVTVGQYKFTASGDDYMVTEAKFTVDNSASDAINSMSLWDGPARLATVPYEAAFGGFYVAGLSTWVPANTSKALTVKMDLAVPFVYGAFSTTGKNVAPTMTYLRALNSQGDVNSQTLSLSSNATYVYKSVPTFTVGSVSVAQQEVNLQVCAQTTLYKFDVAADPAGPVSLKELRFSVDITDNNGSPNETLGSFRFFRDSTDLTSLDVSIFDSVAGQNLAGLSTIGESSAADVVVFFATEEVIPAGQTRTYYLKAKGTSFIGNDAVSTYLKGDAAGTLVDDTTNMVWSDNSAVMHGSDWYGLSPDWFNGYLVQNLPLDSTVLPEPATIGLLACGAIGFGLKRRRNRK